jgi:hypothetical protein
LDIVDAITSFLADIPFWLEQPRIRDRADSEKFIDSYVSELTYAQKAAVLRARDSFLQRIDAYSADASIHALF